METTVKPQYTTQLQAGLGMIEETGILLDLWEDGLSARELYAKVLESGRFSNVSARRLRNIVAECFAPRYLVDEGRPARQLKLLRPVLNPREFERLLFVYTCRANAILADFVREVYWGAYSAGRQTISSEEARTFVLRANQDGRTPKMWSESSIRRVGGYLTGACADFGLLESGRLKERRILPFRLEPRPFIVVSYDLHWSGLGDNSVVGHEDWELFGMERQDVIDELKQQAPKKFFIIQTAANVTRISWSHKSMEELRDALAEC